MGIEKAIRETSEVVEIPLAFVCNRCGYRLSMESLQSRPDDMFEAVFSGGYGDSYPSDLMTISFVNCSKCLKEWTSTFKIPPDVRHVMGSRPVFATHTETTVEMVVESGWARPVSLKEWKEPNWEDAEIPLESCVQSGVWEHFKGNRYLVLDTVLEFGTMEILVLYRALYGDSKTWLRPAKMWQEMVLGACDEPWPRFTKVQP